jgi:type III pantothenate kinase
MKYLIIDIGNTNIVFAVYNENTILKKWRFSTLIRRTMDEYILWFYSTIKDNWKFKDIIIGSVVPDITEELKLAILSFFKKKALVVSEDFKVNFPVRVDNPSELGTDRLVNALCAWSTYQKPSIIVDFGTATTFDVVGKSGIYLGGVIAPGINLSITALHAAAARLPRIAITKPKNIIGKNTVSAMSSGVYWGYIGLIKCLLLKIEDEIGYKMTIIATGGLANLFISEMPKDVIINNDLTIRGLYIAYKESKI